MRECKEKWQLCLIVSVRVHLGQRRPRAGLRSPWNLTGAFFFPVISVVEGFLPECCYYGPKYHFSVRWCTSWVRKSTAQSLSKSFLLQIYRYFQLFVTDFRLCCTWSMSHHNALYQFQKASCRMCCMNLSWCSFYFGEICKAQLRLYRSDIHCAQFPCCWEMDVSCGCVIFYSSFSKKLEIML